MANLSWGLIWLATSIVLGCEERAVAPSGPRGGTVDGSATGNNAHSIAPETTSLPPVQCTRVKDSSNATWKAGGENEPCVYELELGALHNPQLCSKPDSDKVTLSCPEALGPFLGKLVHLRDVRLVANSIPGEGQHSSAPTERLFLPHAGTLIPLLDVNGEALTCRRKGGTNYTQCRRWTEQRVSLALMVESNGLRVLASPFTGPPLQCKRLGDFQGTPPTPTDVEECVYDAEKLFANKLLREVYSNHGDKLVHIGRVRWDFGLPRVHPRETVFDRDLLVYVECDPGPLARVRILLGAKPVPVLTPAVRSPIECGHHWRDFGKRSKGNIRLDGCFTTDCPAWLEDTGPFVARIRVDGLELVLPPRGFVLEGSHR